MHYISHCIPILLICTSSQTELATKAFSKGYCNAANCSTLEELSSSIRKQQGEDVFRIEKPMVFDFLRGIGGRRGYHELSYEHQIGLDGFPSTVFEPEYELVYADGKAVRVELDMVGSDFVGVKLVQQVQLEATKESGRGLQSHVLVGVKDPVIEIEKVFISTDKLSSVFSNLLAVGFSLDLSLARLLEDAGEDSHRDQLGVSSLGLIIVDAFFMTLSESVIVGLEVDAFLDAAKPAFPWTVAVYPQIHLHFGGTVVMFGVGAVLQDGIVIPQFGHRVIVEHEPPAEVGPGRP